MSKQVGTMGVIGAGAMGTGIAQVAAAAGIRVHLIDAFDQAVPRSRKLLEKNLAGGIEREKITLQQAERIKKSIAWETSYDCLAGADWVIEAVYEDLPTKQEVLQRVGSLVGADVPVATNTSTFVVADLAGFFGRPSHFIGMHFFNPPPAMKLVEVIPSADTLPAVTDATIALAERMGKIPKIAPDIPGFVVDRVFGAILSAAIDVWTTGGDPQSIDESIELGLGHKMGPLRTADLVGLDVVLAVLRSLHGQTGHARFEVPEQLVKLVESGKLGRKTGAGFYTYED